MKRCLVILTALLIVFASTQGKFRSYPSEPPVSAAQAIVGKPIKGTGSAVYRLMENGQIRHISDWATFLALGYQPADIVQISQEELATYPLGFPLTRWLTGEHDHRLYFLLRGQRYPIPDLRSLQITGGSVEQVSVLPDDYLNQFPLALKPMTITDRFEPPLSAITAAVWAERLLWVADDTGQPKTWDGQLWSLVELPEPVVVCSLAYDGKNLYAGTASGDVWQFAENKNPVRLLGGEGEQVAALAAEGSLLWYADRGYFNLQDAGFQPGRGLIQFDSQTSTLLVEHEISQAITALEFDPVGNVLWAGTSYTGLLRYDLNSQTWEIMNTLNSNLIDNMVTDIELSADGTLWITTPSRLSKYQEGSFTVIQEGVPSLSLALAADGTLWLAGENMLGNLSGSIYDAFDHPLLLDYFEFVVLDNDETPWFVGRRHLIHFDGTFWTAYDLHAGRATSFRPDQPPEAEPLAFPSPLADYTLWLQTWPRPDGDNGRCMHYLQYPAGDTFEIWEQITRLERLGVRWVLVNYTSPSQLLQMAPFFAKTGMIVVWRPFVRPYQVYDHWAQDVAFLRSLGLPPYLQVYNEPNLPPEWDGQTVDQAIYLSHLIPAVREVYEAGGFVGLQHIDLDWTRTMLQTLKAEGMDYVFDRLFFVPHPYGANHPPDFTADLNGVLSFLEYARVFEEEIGFVPVMIAGEGGWRLGETADVNYPPITEELHRDYHVAVFDWFRNGQLSNGDPLPDYLFAFCPWLISDAFDPAAWYDSASGNRQLTIAAVEAIPEFGRRFSWQADNLP